MRVVIAEDLFLLRQGLTALLESFECTVVAAVDTGENLAQVILEHRPDVAILDVRLPPTFTTEGLEAALAIRRAVPAFPVLVLSQHVEQLYARELLADGHGGVGYLLKDSVFEPDQFIDAVRRVAGGGTAMDPAVIAQLMARRSHDEPIETLTAREREVLALMAEGCSNTAIAERLVVSEGAVTKHIGNIFGKLTLSADSITNRRVLAVLAYLGAG
ncbi:response regulator transcription factor [Rhodococcus sp. 14-2470-1a]|uniref:response regulator n=1 Tax=Rhodococcus sp. 14-2470-1a TaxID=2023150 RepID=UPI000B9C0BFE|nr:MULTISPECIES: response regulator transcription factor [unclassified Rhodococcus (in: high G+C Gram-positive bacteria)]OZD69863.1 DNA-binding response regulator [Rhodococcus sp. 06-1059B-a]OZF56638.1 DNA-binding response regulator [Rhodococcus sp. 14-2470-1a]